jgi:hypothetical protein
VVVLVVVQGIILVLLEVLALLGKVLLVVTMLQTMVSQVLVVVVRVVLGKTATHKALVVEMVV